MTPTPSGRKGMNCWWLSLCAPLGRQIDWVQDGRLSICLLELAPGPPEEESGDDRQPELDGHPYHHPHHEHS